MSTAEAQKADVDVDWVEPGPRMTVEEFLTLPDADGIHRELIRGHLWELGMTVRNRFHCYVESNLVFLLKTWLRTQPEPRGQVLSGEVGFRLHGPEDSMVGIDVAFASAELLAVTGPKQGIFEGPPALAVEILSGSDRMADIHEMVLAYLEVGAVVWVVDPDFRRISVHRPGQQPEMFNAEHELIGDPYLPGFRVAVKDIFT